MKGGNRHLTDRLELPNQDKIRTLSVNETYKYLSVLESSNEWKWKTTFKKNIPGELENYSRQNTLAETLSKE